VTPRNLNVLTARPQYEARVSVIYVFFIFFFFFFAAMALFLGVGDERLAGLVQVAGLIAVLIYPWSLAPLPSGTMAQSEFPPQSKNVNSAYFS
jgi:hypothetical protein